MGRKPSWGMQLRTLSGSAALTMLPTDGVVPSGAGVTAAAGLGRGERAPDMVLPSRDGTPTRYYAHAGGRPALLVLADEACAARLDALAEGLTAIGDADLTVHVVGPPALAGHDLPFPLLQDAEGRAAAAYRTGGAPTVFLLDPNLRVRATLPFATAPASPPTSPRWSPSWSGTTGGRARSPPRRRCWWCRTCSARSSAPSTSGTTKIGRAHV